MTKINRRNFVKITALATAAFAPVRFAIGKAGAPANSRLNVAMIGAGNIAGMAYGGCRNENIVALADVDSSMFHQHADNHPHLLKCKTFADFRVMLDKMEKEIDAVCINTPDHTHFSATMHAMEMGKHVCTQKPLTHNIWQARTLQKAKKKYKVVTNMAVQGHTFNGIRQMKEWYEADVFGQIREVHSWIEGPKWRDFAEGRSFFHKSDVYPPKKSPIPGSLNWDLWLGPNEAGTVFNELYHPKSWRPFNAFGNGLFGDWMPHIADAPVWVLDLFEPVTVELIRKEGGNDWMVPDGNTVRWDFKKRGSKAPCTFYWHNGDRSFMPKAPESWSWGKLPNRGTLYFGDKQVGYTDNRSNNPRLADKETMKAFKAEGYPEETYERVAGGPFKEWIRAIKGEGPEPGANFDYAAPYTEMMLIGVLAARFGGRIEWHPKKGITNRPELNRYVRPEKVREGWDYGKGLWAKNSKFARY
ncbi:Gfo/Idh/MocA family protein [Pelagicoccus mobilis]|uniref:Gfo/Idh/MocA family oxidoreductase n=1 Tax=Pelagicoccus mobilis TaxID=415221 RepID=A0A934S0L3_9BACT|nr:Gfo/Idh/MocA family oxidoreductase [Pelagicoccus mobilis]MBK1877692.1 Gfo/Idh/MocA family oxidoreductase [Pelagicoccus mobilis]